MIRTLIVDDEEPARQRLAQLLGFFGDVEIIGEAVDGDEAVEKISNYLPDLVFLDIQMPGRNGLEVAACLAPPRPRIVFCTAFDQYAIDAFEVHAVDYLLKPVTRNRLAKAVARIRESASELTLARDIAHAEEVQAHLFPRVLPPMTTLDYRAFSRAARGVTGDYYDFLSLAPGRLVLALADVSGKGVPAGLLMACLQGNLQSQSPGKAEKPSELIKELNQLMCNATGGRSFITFFYAVYDDARRSLTYVNAGHNAPILLGAGEDRRAGLETGGMVLGLFPEAEYQQETIELRPSDLLVCYTDGVTETFNGREEEFGEERLVQCLEQSRGLPVSETLDRILSATSEFAEGMPQQDDQTLIVARAKA
jgi:phosphoserine phosphatase RsbU/P